MDCTTPLGRRATKGLSRFSQHRPRKQGDGEDVDAGLGEGRSAPHCEAFPLHLLNATRERQNASMSAAPDLPKASLAHRSRWVRYSVAFVLLIALITALALALHTDVTKVVETTKADEVTTTTFASPTLTSPIVVLAVLLVLAMLLPDVGEFNVLGIGLKMKVEAIEKKATETQIDTRELRGAVQDLRIELLQVESRATALAAAASQSNSSATINLLPDPDVLAAKIAQTVARSNAVAELKPGDDRDSLVGQVVNQWSELRSTLDLTEANTVRSWRPQPDMSDDALETLSNARRRFVRVRSADLRTAHELWELAVSEPDRIESGVLRNGAALIAQLLSDARQDVQGNADQRERP